MTTLERKDKWIFGRIEELEGHTDIVDEAIHSGIKARFPVYLEAMGEFKKSEEDVTQQIDHIGNIR